MRRRRKLQRSAIPVFESLESRQLLSGDTTPPTMALIASDLLVGGDTNYTFSVNYSDVDDTVNAATVNSAQITVALTAGSVTASLSGVVANTDQSITATYQIFAPHGTWSHDDNDTYHVNIAANQVADSNGNYNPPEEIGTFAINIPTDPTPPTASFTNQTITTAGATVYDFDVLYTEDVGINATTFDNNDITVSANGDNLPARYMRSTVQPDGISQLVTYEISAPAPGGTIRTTRRTTSR